MMSASRSLPSAPDPVYPAPRPQYAHLQRLSDRVGLFEHARYGVPRREHGYCVDDVARGLLVTVREPEPSPAVARMTETYLRFLEQALDHHGRAHNRRSTDGFWLDEAAVGDWWGRAVWALGVASTSAPTPLTRRRASRAFARLVQQDPDDLHTAAFATLGAGAVLLADPDHAAAERLVRRFVQMVPRPGPTEWPWPEPRLRYGSASIAEAEILAGLVLGESEVLGHGLRLLQFLLDIEVRSGHLSVSGTGGRGRNETGPLFDQQPIEAAAIADACARAFEVTGDPSWLAGVRMAWAWFGGDNDSDIPMLDMDTGAGFDGLEPFGRNENQGAESTLAALSTWQQARRHLRSQVLT
jgi:hypothetical protein